MRKKALLPIIISSFCLMAMGQRATAQCTAGCLSTSISLNTGYNFAAATTYPIGALDEWWQVVEVPVGSGVAGVPPYCAYVVGLAPNWTPSSGGSMWINVNPTPNNPFNNWTGTPCSGYGIGNPFRFERTFYVCGDNEIDATIQMQMMADDEIDSVWLDGHLLEAYPGYLCPGHPPYKWIYNEPLNQSVVLYPGAHRIDVDMRNVGGLYSGINIVGTVTSTTPNRLALPTCYGKHSCTGTATDCFATSSWNTVYDYTDGGNNCYFTTTVSTTLNPGSTIVDYQWKYPVLPSGYSTTTTATGTLNFTVPDGYEDTLWLTVVAVDAMGDTCKQTFKRTVGCNGGYPVLRMEQNTGINSLNTNSDISIFPNPTDAILNIESGGTKIDHIQIIDITGRILIDNKYNGSTKETISLSKYAPGVYIIKVNDNVRQTVDKLR